MSKKSQKVMQRSAERAIANVCKTFNEIQTGPNPLTEQEIERLIAKHPDRYSVLRACKGRR